MFIVTKYLSIHTYTQENKEMLLAIVPIGYMHGVCNVRPIVYNA